MIKAKEVRSVKEVIRNDGLWRFAYGNVSTLYAISQNMPFSKSHLATFSHESDVSRFIILEPILTFPTVKNCCKIINFFQSCFSALACPIHPILSIAMHSSPTISIAHQEDKNVGGGGSADSNDKDAAKNSWKEKCHFCDWIRSESHFKWFDRSLF